ncbi:DNA polymerase III subunit beta [Thermosipho atlanticus]|uniref:Beta sliding clamp n=1 Tax=Thermosipho atlanticus DSM 15807 TaxID=1123380 RepID=A0A1M5QNU5_9BACT|nr:DNA polymerase III subunit beta [Thermosipho atlanticus]SHH15489.1 DNA polymerase III, beta subunit [Thermosipho atlanticus DSM 15807]
MLKFAINKQEFAKKISVAAQAVGSRTVDPILQCLLFKPENGAINIYSTDMQTFVVAKLPVSEFDGNDFFAVDAKLLEEIVKNIDEDEVIFEYNFGKLNIRSGKTSFNITTYSNPEKFPPLEFEKAGISFEIETSILSEMIDKVIFCASTESAMRALNGVYWEIKNKYLRLVASDGYRLALVEQMLNVEAEIDFIISLKSMKELQNMLSGTDEPVIKVTCDHKKMSVTAGDVTVITRVVEEVFPDYRRVLPKAFKTRISFNKDEFLEALKRNMIIAKRGNDKVKLEIGENVMVLTSQSPEYGEVREELNIEKEGEDLIINFNPRFLNEAVKNIDEEEIVFNFVDELSPMQVNSKDMEGYLYIVLPVRA